MPKVEESLRSSGLIKSIEQLNFRSLQTLAHFYKQYLSLQEPVCPVPAVFFEITSKNGFWAKVKTGATFKPEEYSGISRI
jgi:hypothetical protein